MSDNEMMIFSRYSFSAERQLILFNNFDLSTYEALTYNMEYKSTDFYGRSFLDASNNISNNSDIANNDINDISAYANIIGVVKNNLKKNYKKKIAFPEKQRKKLLIHQLQNYFQQLKDNYLKKKMYIKGDWKKLSKKEKEEINNLFVYKLLFIKKIVSKSIFPFRQ